MHSRAVNRRLTADSLRYLRACADQVQLPWPCPTQATGRRDHGANRSIMTASSAGRGGVDCGGRKAVAPSQRPGLKRRRAMATAVAEQQIFEEDYIPFDPPHPERVPQQDLRRSWETTRKLTEVQPINVSSLVFIGDPLANSPFRDASPFKHAALTDEVAQISGLLDACLRVNRFERAAALLSRLRKILRPGTSQLLHAHNAYIEASVKFLTPNRSESHLQSLQRWFEIGFKDAGVPADATTYALMLKASLQVLQGSKLARTIRRYVDLAAASGQDTEVLNSTMLSVVDLHRITSVCPTEYNTLPEDEIELAAQAEEQATDDDGAATHVVLNRKRTHRERVDQPHLRLVSQKGLGLSSLKAAISLFSDPSSVDPSNYPEGSEVRPDEEYATRRQMRLERDSVTSAIRRWREETDKLSKIGVHGVLHAKPVGALMWEWHQALTRALEEELKRVNDTEGLSPNNLEESDRAFYGPFLRVVSPEKLAATTVTVITTSIASSDNHDRIRITQLVIAIGRAVSRLHAQDRFRERHAESSVRWRRADGRGVQMAHVLKGGRRSREDATATGAAAAAAAAAAPEERKAETLDRLADSDRPPHWPLTVLVRVGTVLLTTLMRIAKISAPRTNLDTNEEVLQLVPALTHQRHLTRGRCVGILSAHPALTKLLAREPSGSFLAKHLPMLVEPRPWTNFDRGGYLENTLEAVRHKGILAVRQYAETAIERGDLDQVLAGLNVLSKTPWRINRAVYDVMLEAWNSGQALADIPPEESNVELPPEPGPSVGPAERRRWFSAFREARNRRTGQHAERCFQNMQLAVAQAFLDETFYLPHNMDFRGRAYPVPPYLNQMGADNCRGLLLFAEGRPLGSAGLDWLKIHLANVYGYDKASLPERIEFVMENLSGVYDSAHKPLAGRRWWLQADDPWQCLATCIELTRALDSPDPAAFVSRLPVHQDGTCNGLQHYAALGGDVLGAQEVNLVPGERPADIYSAVANMIEESIRKEVAQGGGHIQSFLAGRVKRKIVKQTVMTNVYGVTQYGGRKQVYKQLSESIPVLPKDATFDRSQLAGYISERIFVTLSNMFGCAHEIQAWLTESAGRITRAVTPEQIERAMAEAEAEGPAPASTARPSRARPKRLSPELLQFQTSVVWTTPLKLPVVQPYYATPRRSVVTHLQRVTLRESRPVDPVDRRKQMNAFPPNFIHSLDAAHMYLSALRCYDAGLAFASVHDSFWTHAADVDSLNQVIREAFISIHREDVLGRLAEEFAVRYKGCLYMTQLKRSSPIAHEIVKLRRSRSMPSKYENGPMVFNELAIEYKRQQLLRSESEADREEGRRMKTPASIFEAADAADQAQALRSGAEDGDLSGKRRDDDAEAAGSDLSSDMSTGDEDVSAATANQEKVQEEEQELEEDEEEEVGEGELEQGTNSKTHPNDETDKGEAKKGHGSAPVKSKRKPQELKTKIWLPLTFSPVPKKGTFDVERLRNSLYFFC